MSLHVQHLEMLFIVFDVTDNLHCSNVNAGDTAFCGGMITVNMWEDELSVPVMATTDIVYDGDVSRHLDVGISTFCGTTVTYNYTYSSVKVDNCIH